MLPISTTVCGFKHSFIGILSDIKSHDKIFTKPRPSAICLQPMLRLG